jgi:AcrR family transcriptional regulator
MVLTKRAAGVRAKRASLIDIRTRILDAARAIALAEGPQGISARKIAQRVGCSATAIYLYYRNIDDLLHHLRMEGFEVLVRYLQGVDPALEPIERIVALGRQYWRFGREHPNAYELMFLHRFRRVPRPEVVQREIYALMLLRDVVKEGLASGALRRDLDLMTTTNALWAEIHGLTSLAVSGRLLQTATGHDEEVLETLLDGVRRSLRP